MRIILAIKDTDLRLSIELLLSEEPGILIVGSTSNTQGVFALVKSNYPDLALLDWDLPGEPLQEVIENIQDCQTPPEIILLVSRTEGIEEYLAVSAHSYLLKGDPPEKMLSGVRQFL